MAVLLLCGHFATSRQAVKPLTAAEYHRFSAWLAERRLHARDLLRRDLGELIDGISGIKIAADRIKSLLQRSRDLERAQEAWARDGIWVIGIDDTEFPQRLLARLSTAVSPLLFGAGGRQRLNQGGVCIIGSRDSDDGGLAFARRLGQRAGSDGLTVISSDMRGVDREAISATLEAGGRVISVLSDSLIKAVAAKRNRAALGDGSMTLLTPFSPDTRFTVANAMRANKYQYALSDAAVVVETRRSGGIWSGAEENRTEDWVPGFVRAGERMSHGNLALQHLGYWPITLADVETTGDLGAFFMRHRNQAPAKMSSPSAATAAPDLYDLFLPSLVALLQGDPLSTEIVGQHFRLETVQAQAWLDRAVAEGHVKTLQDPTRYLAVIP